MAASTVNLQAGSLASKVTRKAAGLSSSARIQTAQVSLPCRPALVRKGQRVAQANVKRKAEAGALSERVDARSVEALR